MSDHATYAAAIDADLTLETLDGATSSKARLTRVDLIDERSGSFTFDLVAEDMPPVQDVYLVRGADLPEQPVLLVPAAAGGDGVAFHAVFNLIPSTTSEVTP